MDKEELIKFLKENLSIKIEKNYFDFYTGELDIKVSLELFSGQENIEISSDSISLNLKR